VFRIEWHMTDGAQREHHCSSREEAVAMFNNVLFEPGVAKVLAYERVYEPDKSRPEWRLLKMGSDGEIVHDVD
jgi:hypothetical protein